MKRSYYSFAGNIDHAKIKKQKNGPNVIIELIDLHSHHPKVQSLSRKLLEKMRLPTKNGFSMDFKCVSTTNIPLGIHDSIVVSYLWNVILINGGRVMYVFDLKTKAYIKQFSLPYTQGHECTRKYIISHTQTAIEHNRDNEALLVATSMVPRNIEHNKTTHLLKYNIHTLMNTEEIIDLEEECAVYVPIWSTVYEQPIYSLTVLPDKNRGNLVYCVTQPPSELIILEASSGCILYNIRAPGIRSIITTETGNFIASVQDKLIKIGSIEELIGTKKKPTNFGEPFNKSDISVVSSSIYDWEKKHIITSSRFNGFRIFDMEGNLLRTMEADNGEKLRVRCVCLNEVNGELICVLNSPLCLRAYM